MSVSSRSHGLRIARCAVGLALLAGLASCHILRTSYAVEQLNQTNPPSAAVPSAPLSARIGQQVRTHLADSYVDPQRVAGWMAALGGNPDLLVQLEGCIANLGGGDPGGCYGPFVRATSGLDNPPKPLPWGLPKPPPSIADVRDFTSAKAGQELDAERFLSNVLDAGSAVAALGTIIGRGPLTDADLRAGIKDGAALAASYVKARRWHRDMSRRSNAIVVSGGAANGAFGAGFVWRLLGVLQTCRSRTAAEGGCPGARIDLAAGTSTGALISLVVDDFFTPGREAAARDLLLQSYTCSVESDLYCVNDTWDWNLVRDVRGLVRFDGIRKKIETQIPPEVYANDLESVVVSVDFESGAIVTESDQDPADQGPPARRSAAALASIVEPVLAEPVLGDSENGLSVDGVVGKGTFLDGGVRSGLPVMEAMRRGAERVLVLANSGLEPEQNERPKHTLAVLMRTIDLLATQPKVGELSQAELAALVRRFGEYNVCRQRLASLQAPPSDATAPFCERRPPIGVRVLAPPWIGSWHFPQVATSWRSAWVFRPEEAIQTAGGYSFRPDVMRPLFLKGVETFQKRCKEILDLFEVKGTIAGAACSEVVDASAAFRPVDQCTANKPSLRDCN